MKSPDASSPPDGTKKSRGLSLTTAALLAGAVGLLAIMGTALVMSGFARSKIEPQAAQAHPDFESPPAVPDPKESLLSTIHELRDDRASALALKSLPHITASITRRFGDEGSKGVYEALVTGGSIPMSNCVIIVDPERIDSSTWLKTYTGYVRKLGERPYTMTTTVTSDLGISSHDHQEYIESYEAADDPEILLRGVDGKLEKAELDFIARFPDPGELQIIQKERSDAVIADLNALPDNATNNQIADLRGEVNELKSFRIDDVELTTRLDNREREIQEQREAAKARAAQSQQTPQFQAMPQKYYGTDGSSGMAGGR